MVFDVMTRGHLMTKVTFDTVGSNDHISFYPFAGLQLDARLELRVRFVALVFGPDVHRSYVNTFEQDALEVTAMDDG